MDGHDGPLNETAMKLLLGLVVATLERLEPGWPVDNRNLLRKAPDLSNVRGLHGEREDAKMAEARRQLIDWLIEADDFAIQLAPRYRELIKRRSRRGRRA